MRFAKTAARSAAQAASGVQVAPPWLKRAVIRPFDVPSPSDAARWGTFEQNRAIPLHRLLALRY